MLCKILRIRFLHYFHTESFEDIPSADIGHRWTQLNLGQKQLSSLNTELLAVNKRNDIRRVVRICCWATRDSIWLNTVA